MEKGRMLSLVGPSGTGKTTLLRCIAGIERLDDGELIISESHLEHVPSHKRGISMMFQDALLFPHMTVYENAEYGLKLAKVNKKERQERVHQFLAKTEIEHLKDLYPDQLSGGEQQRVSLARALIVRPKLLLLDEPFASLDPILRGKLRIWVKELLKEEGITAMLVTHDIEEAMVMGDEVALFAETRFLQKGTPSDLYYRPENAAAAAFCSEGIYENDAFYHAEQLKIAGTREEKGWQGIIKGQVFKYGLTFYIVELENKQYLNINSKGVFSPGDAVFVVYDGDSAVKRG